jgi:hypothetical protein
MSLVAIFLNLLLAGLLVGALVIGVRLERRLKSVREGQLAFAQAVSDLDKAAFRAREGLAELRAATDESTDLLGGRIARAREASDRLEKLLGRAETATAAPPAASPEGGLAALLRQMKEEATVPAPAPRALAPERPLRLTRSLDDDLFEDAGGRA